MHYTEVSLSSRSYGTIIIGLEIKRVNDYIASDVLPSHIEEPQKDRPLPPLLLKEQEISGLYIFCYASDCRTNPQTFPIGSPVCFILTSSNYPGAIKSTRGRMENEMDDLAWVVHKGHDEGAALDDIGRTLGMVVKNDSSSRSRSCTTMFRQRCHFI